MLNCLFCNVLVYNDLCRAISRPAPITSKNLHLHLSIFYILYYISTAKLVVDIPKYMLLEREERCAVRCQDAVKRVSTSCTLQ